jgi:phage anti-repressor protein
MKMTAGARELHAFLEIGKDFSNWIKDRIEQYGFKLGTDYEIFDSPKLVNQNVINQGCGGDRRSKDCAITLDMTKELSMVERNGEPCGGRGVAARQTRRISLVGKMTRKSMAVCLEDKDFCLFLSGGYELAPNAGRGFLARQGRQWRKAA